MSVIASVLPAALDWVKTRKEHIRPWGLFINTQKFRVPNTAKLLSKRILRNVEYFQTNYMFVFTILFLYCLITSPLLLFVMTASFGCCYALFKRHSDHKMVIFGHELSLANQFALVGVISVPVFYLAGAGAALFWVIGSSFSVIALHASFYDIDTVLGSDEEPFELELEEV